MKFSYDAEADALSLRLTDARVDDTDEIQPGIIVDYDESGQVVAIEMLNVRKRSGQVEVAFPTQSSITGAAKQVITYANYADSSVPGMRTGQAVSVSGKSQGRGSVEKASDAVIVEQPVSP